MESVTYGEGGYLKDHPNGNISERIVDNGDGTGVRTTYDADGNVVAVEGVMGLPVAEAPPDPASSPVEVVRAEMLTAYEAEMAAGTRSLARIDAAIRAALGAS